jgi:two-component system cell cycle sensor histidine kinase/response regulator CckA
MMTPACASFTEKLLMSRGYLPLVAKGGHEALRRLVARADEVAIVVSDYTMPNMGGASVAARIKCLHPSVPVILITGRRFFLKR